jgi:predicted GNAT superfamily acetyltransferase
MGYGSLLYNEVESRSTEPFFTLEVNLEPRNDGSLRFHDRLGFVEVGQQVSGSGKLVSLMAKTLR